MCWCFDGDIPLWNVRHVFVIWFDEKKKLLISLQVVILILGCFTICWLPYFIVACSQIFHFAANSSPIYYKAAFSLAMANSGMNPVIYAWKNRTFRRAFIHLLRCRTPDSHALIDDENARQNMKRKSSSLAPSLSAPPPTPNSVISATPPPISAPDSHHRSSLHRYHHGFTTAFPLPPPPPSPQSPAIDDPMDTVVIGSNVKCVFGKWLKSLSIIYKQLCKSVWNIYQNDFHYQ